MENLLLPKLVIDDWIKFADEIKDIDPADIKTIDFSNVNWVEPSGVLLSGMILKDILAKNPNIDLIADFDQEEGPISYLKFMGYFEFIKGEEMRELEARKNYLPITRINFREVLMEDIMNGRMVEMVDSLTRKSNELANVLVNEDTDTDIIDTLTFCFREILRNIPEHSDVEEAYVFGQYWPKKQEAAISIIDKGMGIKNSLKKNKFYQDIVDTDKKALEFALRPGVSKSFSPVTGQTSKDPTANSGYGLYMTSNICKKLDGTFHLISGDSCVLIDASDEPTYLATNYSGVAVSMKIHADEKSFSKLTTEISKAGEDEAKNNDDAFKKASGLSKGIDI